MLRRHGQSCQVVGVCQSAENGSCEGTTGMLLSFPCPVHPEGVLSLSVQKRWAAGVRLQVHMNVLIQVRERLALSLPPPCPTGLMILLFLSHIPCSMPKHGVCAWAACWAGKGIGSTPGPLGTNIPSQALRALIKRKNLI